MAQVLNGNVMDKNRVDPRLVWLATVLAAAVFVVFVAQG